MSAALTFDNFAFSYQAAAEAELLTERFAAQPNQDGRPLIGPLCTEIEEGSFTLITGATGCGKTTLLFVLLNLLPADSGEIHGFQKPSAVFQEDRLLPYLTAAKNISVAAGCTETAAEKALLQVGFDPEDLKKNAVQLSGGMARRVSIVRAMLTSGDAVLLDEPFKGLDDLTREKVMQFVKENLKNRTMILVTHDPRDAKDLAAVKIIEMETEK